MTSIRKFRKRILLFVVLLVPVVQTVEAQPKKNTSFRTAPAGPSALILESDPSAQLLEGFILMQKANSGDPVAEQEVGLRYLFGRGFPADTVKAALWIEKAARQNFQSAKYNLGILENNGWGVDWNPFEAYKLFLSAAGANMMEAQYIVGLMIIDNLVVPRNWNKAYDFLSRSAAQEYKPAKDVIAELTKRGVHFEKEAGPTGAPDTAGRPSSGTVSAKTDTAWKPILLDLQRDPPTAIDDSTILRDAYREANLSLRYTFEDRIAKRRRVEEDSTMAQMNEAAEYGNPEALTLIGRLYEKGMIVDRNLVLAAEYYIRAVRFDSPRASQLLFHLVREEEFQRIMNDPNRREDPDVLFVWAGLTALQYDQTLTPQKALELLEKGAAAHHIPSLIELGLCSYQGRWVKQDRNTAFALWGEAATSGSKEARVRIAAAKMTGESDSRESGTYLPVLFEAAQEGSLIAQLALAYCYGQGKGVAKNKGEAAKLYRICAERGSQNAFNSLKRMYDEIRPNDPQFVVEE
ncbi:MAG TPA: tetratricopeptide repeat protein [Bacteroidota bacterium]|nr:tetratricopeptide repeat protein [Bacteroidota bacterium]